jgi:hypothetical protein
MIPWEVSMKFEQFKPLFQILQIMENTMLAGILRNRQRWDTPLAVIISQPLAQSFAKIWKFEILAWKCSKFFETFKNYHKNIWIYVYEVFCYKKSFEFEKVSSHETLSQTTYNSLGVWT